jgi:hypothetical protein
MPMKINIGMSRKVGEPNYGSRGASVGLEVELDANIVNQPRHLHRHIARLFRLAKQSIDAELKDGGSQQCGCFRHRPADKSMNRTATPAQLRAITALAKRQGIDLRQLQERFNVVTPASLSVRQASDLIREMSRTMPASCVEE